MHTQCVFLSSLCRRAELLTDTSLFHLEAHLLTNTLWVLYCWRLPEFHQCEVFPSQPLNVLTLSSIREEVET
jgi:hypothetical protein